MPKGAFQLANGEVKVGRHIPFALALGLVLLVVVELDAVRERWAVGWSDSGLITGRRHVHEEA